MYNLLKIFEVYKNIRKHNINFYSENNNFLYI